MVNEAIKKLVKYGLDTGLIQEEDRIYATNQILDVLKLDEYGEPETEIGEVSLEETLKELLDYAHESGVLPEDSVVFRDLFDTRLMNCLMPRPVSYTHLDVYKRQPQRRSGSGGLIPVGKQLYNAYDQRTQGDFPR